MFRPLTPALCVVAAVLLNACSDNPLAPRSPVEFAVPGGIAPGTGNSPADPAPQNTDAGNAGDSASNDPSTPPADTGRGRGLDGFDDPQNDTPDGSQSDAGGQDQPDAGADTGSQDSDSQDSGNQDTGNQDTGDQDTGNQDTGNHDTGNQSTGSQDSGSQDSADQNGESSSSSTPPAGGPSGQQGGNPNGGNGVSTSVSLVGAVQVEVAGGEIIGYRSTPQPAAAGGFCGDGDNGYPLGTWVKTTPGGTSVHANHTHCVVRSEAATITVSFAIAGTYVVAPSGNLLLNVGPDRNIHYITQQNATKGQGVLLGQGSDGSVWELDLSQVQHAGHTRAAVPDGINPLHRRYTALTAVRQGGAAVSAQVTLAW